MGLEKQSTPLAASKKRSYAEFAKGLSPKDDHAEDASVSDSLDRDSPLMSTGAQAKEANTAPESVDKHRVDCGRRK